MSLVTILSGIGVVTAALLIYAIIVAIPVTALDGLEDPHTNRSNRVLAVVIALFMLGGLANHFGLLF